MKEDTLQKLSAMLDGELPSAELPRMVGTAAHDEELRGTWARYQLIGDVLRGQTPRQVPKDFALRVSAAIAGEPAILAPPRSRAAAFIKPLAGAAIAASVALFALLGIRHSGTEVGAPRVAEVAVEEVAPEPAAVAVVESGSAQPQPPAYVTPMPASQTRLNRYLVNYSEHRATMGGPGMLPYVKIVSHQQEP